ncbi:hypothetical protein [Pseudodesulfovibrio portus]|uniref:Uncharacterized protein n=1 Tax=Pseudodesulfovibrio portus TaxID=231439 RepID=A0ABM8ASA1_9BACT|nr:hypothetical protein [Pseudodesulfovibrio portus]BDQ34314.1 hypothetical protein JCM14722_18560 [Pseudodesulfovibrio portus]
MANGKKSRFSYVQMGLPLDEPDTPKNNLVNLKSFCEKKEEQEELEKKQAIKERLFRHVDELGWQT